jgi:hypothetical protein
MAINIIQGYNPSTTEPIDSRQTIANQVNRYAIPYYNAYDGMIVYQNDTQVLWVLTDVTNISNSNGWTSLGVSASYATTASYALNGGGNATLPYTSYTALLKTSKSDSITFGLLTVGEIYSIDDYRSDDDFSNVADVIDGLINTSGSIFRATGRVPDIWENGSQLTPIGVPVATSVLENTLGITPLWYKDEKTSGVYYFDFPILIPPSKTVSNLPNYKTFTFDPYNKYETRYTLTSFNERNAIFSNGGYPNNFVNSILVHSSGFIFIAGGFSLYNGEGSDKNFIIAKINSNGTLNDWIEVNGTVSSIIETPDGGIVVGGYFDKKIIKFDVDFVGDSTFYSNIGDGFNGNVQTLLAQPDGKILVGGIFDRLDGNLIQKSITRLNSDGTLDGFFNQKPPGVSPTYGGINGGNSSVKTIAIDANGKILVGGNFFNYANSYDANIYFPPYQRGRMFVRLNSDGTYDDTFMNNLLTYHYGMFNSTINTIVVQDDGYVIGGKFTNWNIGSIGLGKIVVRNHILKIKTNGKEDIDFYYSIGDGITTDPNRIGFSNDVQTIVKGTDNKLYIGGYFNKINNQTGYNRIARLLSNGNIDLDYNSNEYGFNLQVLSIALATDGSIWVGGQFTQYGNSISSPYLAKMDNKVRYWLYTYNDEGGLLTDSLLTAQPIEIKVYT